MTELNELDAFMVNHTPNCVLFLRFLQGKACSAVGSQRCRIAFKGSRPQLIREQIFGES